MDVVLGGLPDCALAIHIEQQCNSDAIGIESNGPIGFLKIQPANYERMSFFMRSKSSLLISPLAYLCLRISIGC